MQPNQHARVQSPMGNLGAKTSPNAVREAQQANPDAGNTQITGQYLFDVLINRESDQIAGTNLTRMDIVRTAVKTVDTSNFKAALSEMVRIAKETKNEATLKTARNQQNVMRNAYGVMKNVKPEVLAKHGISDHVKYSEIQQLAPTILKEVGIKWDGTKIEPSEQRDARLKQKDEVKVLEDLKRDNPIQIGESLKDWNDRVMSKLDAALEAHIQEKHQIAIDKAAKAVIKDNLDIAEEIGQRILELLEEGYTGQVEQVQVH